MPNEALFVQAGTYDASEMRALFPFFASAGVVDGLQITAGTGLAAAVSAGHCYVPDGAGNLYAVTVPAAQTVSGLSTTTLSNIYVVVDPNTGAWSLTKGAAPSNPFLLIGSATTDATGVTAVSNVRAAATSPLVLPVTRRKGVAVVTTDASGSAVITHNLGAVPGWYAASIDNSQLRGTPDFASLTANTMKVGVRSGVDNSLIVNTSVRVVWAVEV